ncbi:UNVERIFIED_CONTAM: hypothetical protein Sradi_7211500 [Sesamum radiatum]|uniref:Uncharacterized protein n=1 Tax=Sesamum radiatum TaxID=300843 RepID=A0AAW2IQ67_SESRA
MVVCLLATLSNSSELQAIYPWRLGFLNGGCHREFLKMEARCLDTEYFENAVPILKKNLLPNFFFSYSSSKILEVKLKNLKSDECLEKECCVPLTVAEQGGERRWNCGGSWLRWNEQRAAAPIQGVGGGGAECNSYGVVRHSGSGPRRGETRQQQDWVLIFQRWAMIGG